MMEKSHDARGVCGVGPAESTGKPRSKYCPGGMPALLSIYSYYSLSISCLHHALFSPEHPCRLGIDKQDRLCGKQKSDTQSESRLIKQRESTQSSCHLQLYMIHSYK